MNRPFPGVGIRALASLIDSIPVTIAYFVLLSAFGHPATFDFGNGETVTFWWAGSLSWTGLAFFVLSCAFYYVGMEWTFGATIGKLLFGLRVRKANGEPVTLVAALVRYLLRPIDSIFVYLVGAIFIWCTAKNQRLGDLAAGTVVVYRHAEYVAPSPYLTSNPITAP